MSDDVPQGIPYLPAPLQRPSSRGPALYGAILAALLSGLILGALITIQLLATLKAGNASMSPLALWTGLIAVVYFLIAIGLWQRDPKGYSWSLGTHQINAILSGIVLFGELSKTAGSTFLIGYTGVRLVIAIFGALCTRAAKHEFALPSLTPPRRPAEGHRPLRRFPVATPVEEAPIAPPAPQEPPAG